MDIVGRIAALWRYPVKSMGGEKLAAATLDERGIVGDRAWAVRTSDGKLGSGKTTRRFERVDGLLGFRVSYVGETPLIQLPSGATVRADSPVVDAVLSDVAGTPLTLVREAAISHFDSAQIHIVTTSSLRWLAARTGTDSVDARRFRPNVVLETSGDECIEEAWVGRTLRIRETELTITARTVRCVMTTMEQADLPADPSVLRTLADQNEACLGVYAQIVRAGSLTLGDAATLV